MQCGQQLQYSEIQAAERYAQQPVRYKEDSLVRKLEELGIGQSGLDRLITACYRLLGLISFLTAGEDECRAWTIKQGTKAPQAAGKIHVLKLKKGKLTDKMVSESYGSEKSSLKPTDVGVVVNDYLIDYFPQVLDYNFTANIEKEFDEVAEGQKPWDGVIAAFYSDFAPLVEQTLKEKQERKVGERVLGIDPKSGRQVSVKIGRFGPVAQIGVATDGDKPRFAQLQKGQSIDSITLDEVLSLFDLPRTLGELEGVAIVANVGRFGPYVQAGKEFVSLPAGTDPLRITFEEAVELIQKKRQYEQERQTMMSAKELEEKIEELAPGRFTV